MRFQKGFVSTGVLIAILLVILVLGGGAYLSMHQASPQETVEDNVFSTDGQSEIKDVPANQTSSQKSVQTYALSSEGRSDDEKMGGMTLIGSIASKFEYEHNRYPSDMTELQTEFNQNPRWSEKRSEGRTPTWTDYNYVSTNGDSSYVLRTRINPDSMLFDTYLKNLPQRREGIQGGLDCDFAEKGYICFVPFSH